MPAETTETTAADHGNQAFDTDVIVLGAGPTGLTAACLLADAGVRVTLVEAHPGSGDEPRAISLTDETLRIMQQLGVRGELAPEMLLDTGARYIGRRGQVLADVRPGRPVLGQPRKSQFDQPVLEGVLFDAAVRRERIERRFSASATDLAQDANGVTLTVREPGGDPGGFRGDLALDADFHRAAAASGGEYVLDSAALNVATTGRHGEDGIGAGPAPSATIRARWLIACDGGRSFVRKHLGIPLEGSTQEEQWIVVDLLDAGEPEPYATFHCNGARPCVIVPGVQGRRRYEFMLFPGEDHDAMITVESIRRLVAPYQNVDRLRVRRAAVYTAQQRVAARWREGRVLLAGDAAHLMPPFAGQGLNAGMRDAAGAAWRVAAIERGIGSARLIDSYEAERKPHAAQMVRLSKRIGSIVMSTSAVVCALRDALIPALGIAPRVKSWLTEMKFLAQPDYSAGLVAPLSPDAPAAAGAALGRALPQPRVVVQGGPDAGSERQLDELIGGGFARVRVERDRLLRVSAEGGSTTTVRIVDGAVDPAVLDGLAGYSLLVRPDRYVAAVTTPEDEERALAVLGRELPGLRAALAG